MAPLPSCVHDGLSQVWEGSGAECAEEHGNLAGWVVGVCKFIFVCLLLVKKEISAPNMTKGTFEQCGWWSPWCSVSYYALGSCGFRAKGLRKHRQPGSPAARHFCGGEPRVVGAGGAQDSEFGPLAHVPMVGMTYKEGCMREEQAARGHPREG